MNSYFSVGAAQGIQRGLENARRTRIEDDELKERSLDRQEQRGDRQRQRERQTIEDARTDEAYKYETTQRPLRERALTSQVDASETSAKAAKRQLEYQEEDRPEQLRRQKLATDTAEYGLKSAKAAEGRAATQFNEQQQKSLQQAQEEGLDQLLDALEDGADPEYATARFNAKGKLGIRPGTLKFDKATGNISLQHSDGKQVKSFTGNIANLRAALPRALRAPSVTKIGDNDRLIQTGPGGKLSDITPARAAGAARIGGEKFNRQTFIKQAQDTIGQLLDRQFDTVNQQFRFDEKTRDQAQIGNAFVGQIARTLEEQGVQAEPGEVAAMALQAVRQIKGASEIKKQIVGDKKAGIDGDPMFKGATEAQINAEIDKRVRQSKTAAAVALRSELDNFARTRSVVQQEDAEAAKYPSQPKPSKDIKDPDIQAGTPPASVLKEGLARDFKDGSIWTLRNGVPTRIK